MTSKYDRLGDRPSPPARLPSPSSSPRSRPSSAPCPRGASRSRLVGRDEQGHYHDAHSFGRWQAGYAADRPDFAAETVTFRQFAR